jgi:hypothetical protein
MDIKTLKVNLLFPNEDQISTFSLATHFKKKSLMGVNKFLQTKNIALIPTQFEPLIL